MCLCVPICVFVIQWLQTGSGAEDSHHNNRMGGVRRPRAVNCSTSTSGPPVYILGLRGSHLWVELHEDEEFGPPVGRRPLLGAQEAGEVGVLQQRQAVDGALVAEVVPVG